jgi:hypothetical protein
MGENLTERRIESEPITRVLCVRVYVLAARGSRPPRFIFFAFSQTRQKINGALSPKREN